ncbi:LysR family transcriptional regulator [Cystobacter fuscus]|uniref:LysR family transcriptional regulator n=1 Tax=Cystobacter fuscus TaxID=43 RepID=A0A250J600_9BACT|nr:LysR family transcriptional regulator [Cystobacter fuscus]ATB39043.1 LysR family transcriptional regulator [Cystobacter fuscus]
MGTPDLNLLPLFVAVAETWSMSAAARKLGIPKSSVSRGVAALEASLGVQLFHRSTRKVALTTAGSAFYEKVRPVVATLRDITGGLPEQEAEPSGELRITSPMDMGLTFLAQLAAEFSARYPGIQLDIRPTNRTVDLVGEGFDAAIRVAMKLTDSTLVARRLSGLESAIYAAPTYLARRGVPRSFADVASHDWVAFTQWKRLPPPLVSPPRPRLVTDDLLFVHRAIREGLGLGLIPTFLARQDVTAGLLVRVLPTWALKAGSLFFVHPPTEHVPRKVAAFRDFLIAFIEANPLMASSD